MTNRQIILCFCMMAMVATMLAFISIVFIARPAHGSAVCLTHAEARQLWPKRHLYWYSGDHCWSNRRGGPPHGVKYDLIRENHAESLPAPPEKKPVVTDASKGGVANDPTTRRGTPPTIFYPGVSYAGLPVPRMLMDHAPSTLTYRLLDIDELTSRIPDPPECCWPELNADGSLK